MAEYITRESFSWIESDKGIVGSREGLEKIGELIRCKDCKFAEVADEEDGQDGYTCQFHRGSIWFSGSYCSWAERMEDGNG